MESSISGINWSMVSAVIIVIVGVFAAGAAYGTVLYQTQRMIHRQDLTNGSIKDLRQVNVTQAEINEHTHKELRELTSQASVVLRNTENLSREFSERTGSSHGLQQGRYRRARRWSRRPKR